MPNHPIAIPGRGRRREVRIDGNHRVPGSPNRNLAQLRPGEPPSGSSACESPTLRSGSVYRPRIVEVERTRRSASSTTARNGAPCPWHALARARSSSCISMVVFIVPYYPYLARIPARKSSTPISGNLERGSPGTMPSRRTAGIGSEERGFIARAGGLSQAGCGPYPDRVASHLHTHGPPALPERKPKT